MYRTQENTLPFNFQIHGQRIWLLIGHLQLEPFFLLCSPTPQDCSVGQKLTKGLGFN